MEVLLLQDIAQVGKKNDLLVVGDGYALNYLLPHRLALVATPVVRRRYAEAIRKRAEEREMEKRSQQSTAAALTGKIVTFVKKATKNGKLYAAISEDAIAEALKEQHQLDVPAGAVVAAEPIKALGTFSVNVEIAGQTLPVQVKVSAEK